MAFHKIFARTATALTHAKLLALALLWYVAPTGAMADACQDFSAVNVKGKVALPSDSAYLSTRTELLDSLLIDAVAQVNGAKIRSRETMKQKEVNGALDDRYDANTVRTLKGLVKSYSFPAEGEAIHIDPIFGKMLSLELEVIVCNRSAIDTVYVSLGEVKFPQFQDFSDQYMLSFVRDAIPPESNLRLVEDEDDVAFFDYVISGRIINISATAEDSVIKALIGNVVRTGDGKPIVDSVQYRLSATVALKAENAVDKSYTVTTQIVERIHSSAVRRDGALAQRANEFAGEAVGEVAQTLFQRIINQEGFKKPFRRQ